MPASQEVLAGSSVGLAVVPGSAPLFRLRCPHAAAHAWAEVGFVERHTRCASPGRCLWEPGPEPHPSLAGFLHGTDTAEQAVGLSSWVIRLVGLPQEGPEAEGRRTASIKGDNRSFRV